MPPFYRKNEHVQDAMGRALSGARLYVVEQPAFIHHWPPAPLATLWRNADGSAGQLPNPVHADGRGNLHYYAESAFYTEVYWYQGTIRKILADQAVGCVCPGTGGGIEPVPYTFGIPTDNVMGAPSPGVPVLLYTAFTTTVFSQNFSSPQSYGNCRLMPQAPAVYTVYRDDNPVGTVAVDTNGLFSFSTDGFILNPGDLLMVMPPDPPDPAMSDVAITFVATRLT